MIIIQSPLRVSFFGGGTDLPSYYLSNGGCVLSSTINKYIFITVKRRFDDMIRVGYTKTEMVDNVDHVRHDLIREALRMTGVTRGVEITTMGDIPSAGSGLGSSSTVTVGALQALYSFRGEIVTPDRLAEEACKIELNILGKPIGVQDQIIAACGGLRFIEFEKNGQIGVQELRLRADTMREINESLLLFYTGIPRSADKILSEQLMNIQSRLEILSEMKQLAVIARKELEHDNIERLGDMLHYGWNLKKKMASQITNRSIDDMYQAARRAGALGGKITGAGGGGFLLLFCPKEKHADVREALHQLKELPFRLEKEGVKPIFNYPRLENGTEDEIQRQFTGFKFRATQSTQPEGEEYSTRGGRERDVREKLQAYISTIQETIDKLPIESIDRVVSVLHRARIGERKIYTMGNGGSATTAAHFVCDLNKNLRCEGLPDFNAHNLTDNIATFSAYANDNGYENVFIEQLSDTLESNDIVIAISASGNSSNVLRAVEFANQKGAITIGFTGFDGGQLHSLVDLSISIDNNCIEQVEDVHLMLEHMIVVALRQQRIGSIDREMEVDEYSAEIDLLQGNEKLGMRVSFEISSEDLPGAGHGSVAELYYLLHRTMISTRPIGELLGDVLTTIMEFMRAETGSLLIVDENNNLSGGMVFYEGRTEERGQSELAEIGKNGLARWVVDNRMPTIIENTAEDSRWLQRYDQQINRTAVSVPIFILGRFFGILSLSRQGSAQFTTKDVNLLSGVGVVMSLNGITTESGDQWIGSRQDLPRVE